MTRVLRSSLRDRFKNKQTNDKPKSALVDRRTKLEEFTQNDFLNIFHLLQCSQQRNGIDTFNVEKAVLSHHMEVTKGQKRKSCSDLIENNNNQDDIVIVSGQPKKRLAMVRDVKYELLRVSDQEKKMITLTNTLCELKVRQRELEVLRLSNIVENSMLKAIVKKLNMNVLAIRGDVPISLPLF